MRGSHDWKKQDPGTLRTEETLCREDKWQATQLLSFWKLVLLHFDFLRKKKEGVLRKFQQTIYGKNKPLFWVLLSLWKFWNSTNSRTKLNLSGKSPVSSLHCRACLRWGINELEKPNPFVIRMLKLFVSGIWEEGWWSLPRKPRGDEKVGPLQVLSGDMLEDGFLPSHLAGGREAGRHCPD